MSRLIVGPDAYRWMFSDAQSSNDCQIISRIPAHIPRPYSEDEVEYVLEEDRIWPRLKYPDEDPSLGPDADKVTYYGPRHLCNSCLSAIGYLVRHHQERRAYELAHPNSKPREDDNHPARQPFSAIQHGNYCALLRAMHSGCHICRIIGNSCRESVDEALQKAPSARPPFTELLFNTWNETGDEAGDFRLVCVFNTVRQNDPPAKHNYLNVVRFQLWPSPEMDQHFRVQGQMDEENPLTQDVSTEMRNGIERYNTRSSRPLAQRWLHECMANEDGRHYACNTNEPSWLPTRLLDLSDIRTSRRVRLVMTGQMESKVAPKYASLSHCWGEWGGRRNLPMLTQSTLSSMQSEGLDYEVLPQTFKDAVDIIEWFDVKHLWIDSLCILQDSKNDWVTEASQMSQVYANALLNVSASLSSDARGGCFANRDPVGCEPFELKFEGLEKTWMVTLDERNLFDWMGKEPLTTRAWVYQERQLSPRVLHFTGREVFWECMAKVPSFKSELWPRGSPLRRGFLGQSKIVQSSPPPRDSRNADDAGKSVVHDIWDELCEGFSRRRLTYPTDKLPSLSGLASHFSKTRPNDTYLAGHWRRSLPRTLLWSVKDAHKIQRPAEHQHNHQQHVAPSWSWLSPDTPILAPPFDDMHSILDINAASTTPQTFDPYGSISGATLLVTGLIRRITCSTEPSPFTGFVYELYRSLRTAEERKLYVDGDLKKGHHIGFVCGAAPPDFEEHADYGVEESKWRDYHCLFVGVTVVRVHGILRRSVECLLLERVEGTEVEVFRRVGRLSIYDGKCALKMRYQLKEGDQINHSDSEAESDADDGDGDVEEAEALEIYDEESQGLVDNDGSVDERVTREQIGDREIGNKDTNSGESSTSSVESVGESHRLRWSDTQWRRFWRQVEPCWSGGDYQTPPKETSITNSGPMSLYEYDGGTQNDKFEKLTPREIALI